MRVVLKSGRDKSLKRRHPWLFSGAIARVEGEPQSGDTVEVVSDSGQPLALAAYSPQSQIRARVWSFDTVAAHRCRVPARAPGGRARAARRAARGAAQ